MMNPRDESKIVILWRDLIKGAEDRCDVTLHDQLESYLVSLLMRYTNNPKLVKEVVAPTFLEAINESETLRRDSLARVGDQCLLITGLFPAIAEKRQVKVRYYVNLGRSAYGMISHTATDLYGSLAVEFVQLMDVLQSVNENQALLPLEAYELWEELGSKRALKSLQEYGQEGLSVANFMIK